MTPHVHAWGADGRCQAPLTLGIREAPCHARRCAVTGCTHKRRPPMDHCDAHRGRNFELRTPMRTR